MSLADAIREDEDDNVVVAAELYERELKRPGPPAEAFLNLLVLYWQATDYGFWTEKGLPLDFVKRAGERLRELLEQGEQRYPENVDVTFWLRYIKWCDLGDDLDPRDVERWIAKAPESVEPSLFLFMTSQGARHREAAIRLLHQYEPSGTQRSKYIGSVIQSVLDSSKLSEQKAKAKSRSRKSRTKQNGTKGRKEQKKDPS